MHDRRKTPEPQAEAIGRAQTIRLTLTGLIVAYDISPEQLHLLLVLPEPVQHALDEFQDAVLAVAQMLAHQHGAEWDRLTTRDKVGFQVQAFDLVDALPPPNIPHASGLDEPGPR